MLHFYLYTYHATYKHIMVDIDIHIMLHIYIHIMLHIYTFHAYLIVSLFSNNWDHQAQALAIPPVDPGDSWEQHVENQRPRCLRYPKSLLILDE